MSRYTEITNTFCGHCVKIVCLNDGINSQGVGQDIFYQSSFKFELFKLSLTFSLKSNWNAIISRRQVEPSFDYPIRHFTMSLGNGSARGMIPLINIVSL